MAATSALGILGLVLLLQIKHAICDGPLQVGWMLRQKGQYGQPGGLAHAAIHAAGTLAVLLVFGVAAGAAAVLALIDGAIHYHIDFAKENIVRRSGWTPSAPYFWWALTADQMFHQITYTGLAAAVVQWT